MTPLSAYPERRVPLSVTVDSGTTGQLLSIQDDTYSQVVDLGFSFTFFGNTYTKCVLSTNVYITFDTTQALQYSPWPINDAAPSPLNPLNSIYGPLAGYRSCCSPVRFHGFWNFWYSTSIVFSSSTFAAIHITYVMIRSSPVKLFYTRAATTSRFISQRNGYALIGMMVPLSRDCRMKPAM